VQSLFADAAKAHGLAFDKKAKQYAIAEAA
jgi:hypothetical protein